MRSLKCLLCGATDADIPSNGWSDLVKMQEHLMEDHRVGRDNLERATREVTPAGYVWRLPDGRKWLEETKT